MIDIIIFFIIIIIKIFLFPTSQSTDFEVHRNWKAITNSLPISKWYFYSKNKWTLDYPPLFAYMEYILGKLSKFFDPNITDLDSINYDSFICKTFMRGTVLLGDLFLFFSLKFLSRSLNLSFNKFLILLISIQFYAGLVIIDNMHFQYNGILFGLFFISLGYIAKKKYTHGAIFYIICLCMKHIFIYFAAAYFIFYLQYIIINNIQKGKYKFMIANIIYIGLGIYAVLQLTFLPFIAISIRKEDLSQLIQIKDRLFPVQRGLLHTYWAPNFWALYSFADKILYFVHDKFSGKYKFIDKIFDFILKFKDNKDNDYKRNTSSIGASENGVSKETGFDIMPDINIKITNIIIVTFIIIYYIKYFYQRSHNKERKIKNRKSMEFIKHCIFSNLIFFNFGYQVHEKAFLNISLLALIYYILQKDNEEELLNKKRMEINKKYKYKYFDILSNTSIFIIVIGILAQLPLIHEPKDYFVKISLSVSYFIFCKTLIFNKKDFNSLCMTSIIVFGYITFSLMLDFFVTFQNIFDYDISFPGVQVLEIINSKFPFLFLMFYSVFNSTFTQIIFILLFF